MAKKSKPAAKEVPVESMDDGSYPDIVMIQALQDSLSTIFSTMVRLKIKPGVPVPKPDNAARGEVSGLIGMKSEGVKGSVALSFSLPVLQEISRSMMGHEIASLDKDAIELTGELTNMLAGGAKCTLSEKGHDFDMQTPKLLVGDGHEIEHHHAGQTMLLPVKMGKNEFYIELNFV